MGGVIPVSAHAGISEPPLTVSSSPTIGVLTGLFGIIRTGRDPLRLTRADENESKATKNTNAQRIDNKLKRIVKKIVLRAIKFHN